MKKFLPVYVKTDVHQYGVNHSALVHLLGESKDELLG